MCVCCVCVCGVCVCGVCVCARVVCVCVTHPYRCKTSDSRFSCSLPRELFPTGGGCMVWQSSTNEDTAFLW